MCCTVLSLSRISSQFLSGNSYPLCYNFLPWNVSSCTNNTTLFNAEKKPSNYVPSLLEFVTNICAWKLMPTTLKLVPIIYLGNHAFNSIISVISAVVQYLKNHANNLGIHVVVPSPWFPCLSLVCVLLHCCSTT